MTLFSKFQKSYSIFFTEFSPLFFFTFSRNDFQLKKNHSSRKKCFIYFQTRYKAERELAHFLETKEKKKNLLVQGYGKVTRIKWKSQWFFMRDWSTQPVYHDSSIIHFFLFILLLAFENFFLSKPNSNYIFFLPSHQKI